MKIVYILVVIGFCLYFIWRSILKRLNEKFELQKLETKIVGNTTTTEIDEIDFLAKHFKGKFKAGWKKRIREKILIERFEELTKKYNILVDKK
jgi:HAMP domain-containing protein